MKRSLSKNRRSDILKCLGPGLLWAGTAIGVSHLVQSTRAGASFGFTLVWVVVLANLLKYPFFEYGPRYAAATGESLLEGYKRLGNWALGLYLVLTFGMMFAVQAAVTVVTAALAIKLTGITWSPVVWSAVLLVFCAIILIPGKYPLLDKSVKLIIILLSISTVVAVATAVAHGHAKLPEFHASAVWNLSGISFIVALMGWMPSAFDIAVWNSLWTLERSKQTGHKPALRDALLDFNLGYIVTTILALCFLTLGAMVMYGTGEQFDDRGAVFAGQFIALYTKTLGGWSYPVIVIAGFTTMFSTTLTCLDAFPRALKRSTELIFPALESKDRTEHLYWGWMLVVTAGAIVLLTALQSSMTFMVDLATTLSFVTAPILGYINYRVVNGDNMPEGTTPPPWLQVLSIFGLTFLMGFSILFLVWKFVY